MVSLEGTQSDEWEAEVGSRRSRKEFGSGVAAFSFGTKSRLRSLEGLDGTGEEETTEDDETEREETKEEESGECFILLVMMAGLVRGTECTDAALFLFISNSIAFNASVLLINISVIFVSISAISDSSGDSSLLADDMSEIYVFW